MPKDEKTMSYGEHLLELRRRLIIALAVTFLLFFAVFFLLGTPLLNILREPVTRAFADFKLRTLTPFEIILVKMKVSLIAAIVLASPVLLHQVWQFVSPGLRDNELRHVKPVLAAGSVLFAAGVALCYFLVVPKVYGFFIAMNAESGVEAAWSLSSFIDTELLMLVAFGLSFEAPLVVVFLSVVGLVTPQTLAKNRGYALLFILIFSAVVTADPSAITMLMLAIPLYLLYELGVAAAKIIQRRREKKLAG